FNLSYNVTLNVTDTGFRAPTDAQKPNWANRTSSVQVSVDVKQHPDLRYVAASLKIEPGQPEEGQLINVSFMVDNDKNRANATNWPSRQGEGTARPRSRRACWSSSRAGSSPPRAPGLSP